MADQQTPASKDVSPFDVLWSWLATATLSASVVVFMLMSLGQPTIFGVDNPLSQSDAKVNIAYFGALVCGGGLLALGIVALHYLKAGSYGRNIYYWPRYSLLEGEARHPFVARVAFVAILLIPLVTIYAGAYRYLRDSKVACWDAPHPLSQGFFASRLAALSENCQGSTMLRMAPKDGQPPEAVQWFFWTDVLLGLTLIAAVIVWIRYLLRIRVLQRQQSYSSEP